MVKLSDVEEVIYQDDLSDADFAKQVINECSNVKLLFSVRCKVCKGKYSLLECRFENGDPTCPICKQ
jgi:hypothetical protein